MGNEQLSSYPAVVFDLGRMTGRPWTIQTATRLIKNDVYRVVQRFGQWASEKAHEAKEKFARDCIGSCAKVMNLDHFDLR